MRAAMCEGGVLECLSVYQTPKTNITHVAAISQKQTVHGQDSESDLTKLHYFMLPNDITSSQYIRAPHASTPRNLCRTISYNFS